MSISVGTATLRLNDDNGTTVLLKLANGESSFSLGSNIWLPVSISTGGGSTGSYTFTGGLVEGSGVVVIDPDTIIDRINEHSGDSKISAKLLDIEVAEADIWEDLRQ